MIRNNHQHHFTRCVLAVGLLLTFWCRSYAQSRPAPEILATGNPPLTRIMAEQIATTIGWLLSISFNAEQRDYITASLVRDWQSGDQKKIEPDLNWLRTAIAMKDKSTAEREAFRREAAPRLIEGLRADRQEPDNAWLLAQWEAARPRTSPSPSSPAGQSTAGAGAVRTWGEVSLVLPEGARFQPQPNGNVALLRLGGPGWQCDVTLLQPFRSSGDTEQDLRGFWQRTLRRPMGGLWEGASSLITYAGYPGKFAVESVEGAAQLQITILQAHAQAVPVVRLCSSNSVWYEHGDLLSQLFESIRIAPDRAQPPKTRISVADLAGQWHEGGSDNTGWVDPRGNYAGTSLVAHGITYEIAADGTYSSLYAGLANGQVLREQTTGSVSFGDGRFVVRDKSNHVSRYWFLRLQEAPDGSSVLSLLPNQYEITEDHLRSFTERWFRGPKK
jgi:hypothetical protein